MAEVVFGVVCSGFAVASLAIQLLEVSQKAHTFFDSFVDSNATIERVKDHLQLLQLIPTSIIEICHDQPGLKYGDTVLKSLALCIKSADKLNDLTAGLSLTSGHGRTKRKWSTVKATLREKTIAKFESQLRGDVMMLLLALQPFFHHVQLHSSKSLAHSLTKVSDAQKSLIEASTMPKGSDAQDVNSIGIHGKSEISDSLIYRPLSRDRRMELWSQLQDHKWAFKIDSYSTLDGLLSALGSSLSSSWCKFFEAYIFSIVYTSSNHRLYLPEESLLVNVRRRLRVILPMVSFQIQSSSLPRTISSYPIVPCQSHVFSLCVDGNIDAIKVFFKKALASPFAVNQHGENLLHAAARYAHADLCIFLLRLGVDGSAYDDRLLTPLDHLARKVCMSYAYPSKVVNTIRALVELGHCQPLLPLTSNAVSFYRGPEEGFAWLFASEYAGVDLEEYDSEGWTLLGDAAFNFGWWTQLCSDDPAVSWQTLYLLRAGVDPHKTSSEGTLTPLDAFLRGCTRHQVDHASKWLAVLKQCGVDLRTYAEKEKSLCGGQQYLKATWDEELWRWVPTKRQVVYCYGLMSDDLDIWVEDYDALSWFRCGRYDLDIFEVMPPPQTFIRWNDLNSGNDFVADELHQDLHDELLVTGGQSSTAFCSLYMARWFQILVVSLVSNYLLHLFLS